MAAAAMGKLCNSHSYSSHRLTEPAKKKLLSSPKFILTSSSSSSKSSLRLASPPPINATNSPTEDETSSTDTSNGILIPQEDLKYLWKVGIGSVAGAGLIKYGSVVFPDITRPNLVVALLIISTPVILAVFLLINKSGSK